MGEKTPDLPLYGLLTPALLSSSFPFFLCFPLPESLGFSYLTSFSSFGVKGVVNQKSPGQSHFPVLGGKATHFPWLWIVPEVFLSESQGKKINKFANVTQIANIYMLCSMGSEIVWIPGRLCAPDSQSMTEVSPRCLSSPNLWPLINCHYTPRSYNPDFHSIAGPARTSEDLFSSCFGDPPYDDN